MPKSTSALTLLVKTEVSVQLSQEATNVYVMMDFMAKTANIPAMLAILTLAKMEAIAGRLKQVVTFAIVLQDYQVLTAKQIL